jgi:hypothetical protein
MQQAAAAQQQPAAGAPGEPFMFGQGAGQLGSEGSGGEFTLGAGEQQQQGGQAGQLARRKFKIKRKGPGR